MPKANEGYVACLKGCILAALGEYELPAMIPTSDLVPEVERYWVRTPYGKTVDLNAVIIGRMMGRLGFAQVHGATRNGWFVDVVRGGDA